MKKLIFILLVIGITSTITGCGMKKTVPTATTENNEITTPEGTTATSEKETTTAVSIDAPNYDTDKIKIIEWSTNSYGGRIPSKIIVNDITYEYAYDDTGLLQSIKGTDGTSVELKLYDGYKEIIKDGTKVKYFPYADEMKYGSTGFEYEGKKYTYRYNDMNFITGIFDENDNLVAEYKYSSRDNGCEIEVINHTDDNIGDINSLRYSGRYYDDATGFVFWGKTVNNVLFYKIEPLKG